MAFIHGKTTVVKVGGTDLSAFCKTSTLEVTADVHETTGYGSTAHTKQGGLLDGSFTVSGTYDNTASTGPRGKLLPLVGVTSAIIRQSEGAGSGKAQDSFNGILKKYTETSPVDDMVTWSADFEVTGPNVTTVQP